MATWPFPVPPDTEVSTNPDILQGGLIKVVMRGDDGYWSFFPGPTMEGFGLSTLGAMVAQDPGLIDVADLALGQTAKRFDASSDWVRS